MTRGVSRRAEGAPELLPFLVIQVGAEMEHVIQDVIGFEIGHPAFKVDGSSGVEPALLKEDQPDAPCSPLYGLAAAAAGCLPAGRALRAVNPRKPVVLHAVPGRALERGPLRLAHHRVR